MTGRSVCENALTMSRLLVWKERAEKAEATIKEISELIAYYRDIDAENPDETIRMIAVADELQAALNPPPPRS